MTKRMKNRAKPVGFATPGIKPNRPGLVVNNHSLVVKFLALMVGELTTIRLKLHTCIIVCRKL